MSSFTVMGLDFETYSPAPLPVCGLTNYVNDKNFKVLIAAVAIEQGDGVAVQMIDFTVDHDAAVEHLEHTLRGAHIVAHNAGFERAVLKKLGIEISPAMFLDSAVFASASGFGRSLEAAAPQVLNIDKMASGKEGIQLFCIPGTYQMAAGDDAFDPQVIEDHPNEWLEFKEYCALDAGLSIKLMMSLLPMISSDEMYYSACTLEMNTTGWHVDMPLVAEMHKRYMQNVAEEKLRFQLFVKGGENLNLNSSVQLSAWCLDRGIRIKSFDKLHVTKHLHTLREKVASMAEDDPKLPGYQEVVHLLEVKQTMGGSSLKKLQTLIDTVDDEGMLYDQYLHIGASTTRRTSGRGVQLQNLKRLGSKPDDVQELYDPMIHWDNEKLARNLRQVFTSRHPDGQLIVGDFSAIESRGLAWLAGEEWKLDAYRNGTDVYKVQAAEFYGTTVENVTKDQRQFGKVGELSCGYEAGGQAVKDFAEAMGVMLSMGEAKKLVTNFRQLNPKIVSFWKALHDALWEVADLGISQVAIPHGTITFQTTIVVDSLKPLAPDTKTLIVKLKVHGMDEDSEMVRMYHGFHATGRGFEYWKPSERKTGDLWRDTYTNPKTGRQEKYTLYGGKLAGHLTQSLCREMFMHSMSLMTLWAHNTGNVFVTGQFHDELVVDWVPGTQVIDPSFEQTKAMLERVMLETTMPEFPMACSVQSDYRYIK